MESFSLKEGLVGKKTLSLLFNRHTDLDRDP